MKKLRFFGLLVTIALLAFGLTVGCSNGSTDEEPEAQSSVFTGKTASGQDVEITFSNVAIAKVRAAGPYQNGFYLLKIDGVEKSRGRTRLDSNKDITFIPDNGGTEFHGELLNGVLEVSGTVDGAALNVRTTTEDSGTTPGGVGGGGNSGTGGGNRDTSSITYTVTSDGVAHGTTTTILTLTFTADPSSLTGWAAKVIAVGTTNTAGLTDAMLTGPLAPKTVNGDPSPTIYELPVTIVDPAVQGQSSIKITGVSGLSAASSAAFDVHVKDPPIDTVDITVVLPYTDGTPNTVATKVGDAEDIAKYSVSAVTWTFDDNGTETAAPSPFEDAVQYTATVILSPVAPYEFDTVSNMTVTINTETATVVAGDTAGTLKVSYEFPATRKQVTDMVVKTPPTKMAYEFGDIPDYTDLEVTVTYVDTTTEDIGVGDFGVTFSVAPAATHKFQMSDHNTTHFVVTYHGEPPVTAQTTAAVTVARYPVKIADLAAIWPTNISAEYGKQLKDLDLLDDLTEAEDYTQGTLEWDDEDLYVGSVATPATVKVKFTPANTTDYDYNVTNFPDPAATSGDPVWKTSYLEKEITITTVTPAPITGTINLTIAAPAVGTKPADISDSDVDAGTVTGYSVTDATLEDGGNTGDGNALQAGDTPKITVELTADANHKFVEASKPTVAVAGSAGVDNTNSAIDTDDTAANKLTVDVTWAQL